MFLAATAQAALVYIDRARLRHMLEEGTPRASALMRLLDEPTSSLSTILFIYTLALCAGAAVAFWFDVDLWADGAVARDRRWASSSCVRPAADAVPGARAWPLARPEQVALTFVRPVEMLNRVLFFIVLLPLNALDAGCGALLGVQHGLTPADAEDRLRHLVEGNADLEEDEREMIASVIELGEQPVREVMVPRIDIVAATRPARRCATCSTASSTAATRASRSTTAASTTSPAWCTPRTC